MHKIKTSSEFNLNMKTLENQPEYEEIQNWSFEVKLAAIPQNVKGPRVSVYVQMTVSFLTFGVSTLRTFHFCRLQILYSVHGTSTFT